MTKDEIKSKILNLGNHFEIPENRNLMLSLLHKYLNTNN